MEAEATHPRGSRVGIESTQWTLYSSNRNDHWHRYDQLKPIDELDRDSTRIFGGRAPLTARGPTITAYALLGREMHSWSREPEDDRPISSVLILLDTLSPAERRDLANSLLRAAWSATLEHTRILLLDALVEVDHDVFGDAA